MSSKEVMETNQTTVDTLFKSKNLIVTRESTELVSYLDISTLIESALIFILSLFLVNLLTVMVGIIKGLGGNKEPRNKKLSRGLHVAMFSAWFVDLYMLVSLPMYNRAYILIGLCLTVLVYDIIVIVTELGKVGFSIGTVFQLGGAVAKSIFRRDPEPVADFLGEIGREERMKEREDGEGIWVDESREEEVEDEKTLQPKKKRSTNKLPLIIVILLLSLFPVKLRAPEEYNPYLTRHAYVERCTRTIKLTKEGRVIYTIKISCDKYTQKPGTQPVDKRLITLLGQDVEPTKID